MIKNMRSNVRCVAAMFILDIARLQVTATQLFAVHSEDYGMDLHELVSLWAHQGAEMAGSDLQDNALLSFARKHNPTKSCCIVRDWFYLDLETSEAERGLLTRRGWKPAVVLALSVVHDERERFPPGGWVKSGLQVAFVGSCIFETDNTLYLLQGWGYRKSVSTKVLSSLS